MKMNFIIQPSDMIYRFGQARLIRRIDGKHELVGGSPQDRAEAGEWVSLFAHDIVFSRPRECNPPTGYLELKQFPPGHHETSP